ncbi:DUF5085 family protein [Cerasibacillus sp. JNUCC 74]
MITPNYHIAYRNVASKYYRFVPEEIDLALKDFQSILEKNGYQLNGSILFTILSDPTSEVMDAEIFLPIIENIITIDDQEQIYFHSYLSIKPMIMTRVLNNFESQSQTKYWELMNYIRMNGMKQKTPVFVEYKTSYMGRHYVEMSVGV